jgi:hypothetical protein
VGPPRPKNKSSVSNRFVRNVLKLELRSLQKAAIHAGLKPPLEARWVTIEIPCWSWRLGEKILAEISVRIELRGGTGSLRLVFNANGEPVTQTFAIVHIPTRIGGGHWVIQCPKTHNPVVPGLRRAHFQSRHALKLEYRSKSMPVWERHWERCQKLMERLGADDCRNLPPRPKYMRRSTYARLSMDISETVILMYCVVLERDPDDCW